MPKKSSLMNDREREICRRVREFRESIKWPQPAFAYELGITRDQLASVEYCRTPLRYDLALRAGIAYDMSLHWLGTGEGPVTSLWGSGTGLHPKDVPDGALFSEVFDNYLREYAADETAVELEVRSMADGAEDLGDPPLPDPLGYIVEAVSKRLNRLKTPTEKTHFARSLIQVMLQLDGRIRRRRRAKQVTVAAPTASEPWVEVAKSERRKISLAIKKRIEELQHLQWQVNEGRQILESKLLDFGPDGDTVASVKPKMENWNRWLKKLQRLCDEPGMQSRVAEAVGATKQHVSNWVTETSSPSADFTLRLVEWIKAEEAKEKT